ncbi:MAG TPA: ribonuclease R [Crenotrichaceae bacterium]|nr:ribonuclease R [Crenotrichaceae bacterium]
MSINNTKPSRSDKNVKKNTHRKFRVNDPHRERESSKYEQPIPSRECILELFKEKKTLLSRSDIADELGVVDDNDLESLRRRLRAMERDGQLLFNRKGLYCRVDNTDLIAGRVIGHKDGFGFLKPDTGSDDLFLLPREMRSLFHNDRVLVRVSGIDRRGRREAVVVEILERNTTEVVGRLQEEMGMYFVAPDSKYISLDIVIPTDQLNDAKPGQVVVIGLIKQPGRHSRPIGKVVEVLGDHMAPGMEIEIAIRAHELPHQWPDQVIEQMQDFPKQVKKQDKHGREDLRDTPLVTIDGEDAKDFDDAVFCESTAKGWRLVVAIADVSHYVMRESALDKEAYNRSTSVYFPEYVIPMLPEALSNGLCSLLPDQDRLCMACEIYVSHAGKVTRSRFFEAVIRSHARLTYTDVASMLVDKNKKLRKKHHQLIPHLDELYQLYKVLRQQREQRGTIDFESREYKFVFGEGRKIEKIVPTQSTDAHRLIEECMILANTTAAKFLKRKKIPSLLRVHDGPKSEKIADLKTFLSERGLTLEGGKKPKPIHFKQLLSSIKQRPDAHLIQMVLLRSLSQAVYTPENKGHFGLALNPYTHFTSPIRRYPDLLVHRAIRHCLSGKPIETYAYSIQDMVVMGEHCSANERRADEAGWDVTGWLKCEYMLSRVGEDFTGRVSSVTSFGLFIELDESRVEGLVHISSLGKDYYHFDPIAHRLIGERSGQVYQIGDAVTIKVARVDLDERKIDFDLLAPLVKSNDKKSHNKRSKRSKQQGKRKTGTKTKTRKSATK